MPETVPLLTIRRIDQKNDIDRYIRFAWQVYKGNPCWVPPVIRDIQNFLGGRSHYFKHCSHALWVAEEDSKIIATLAAFYDKNFFEHWHKRVGFFGYFEALEGKNEAVGQLIRCGEEFLKQEGAEEVWAPVNGNTSNSLGFLMDKFNESPTFLMPYSPSYYPQFFRRAGYSLCRELIAFTMDLMNGRLRRKVNFILKRAKHSEISLRPFNRKKFREESDHFTDIFSYTFKDHWGHAPQSKDEIFEILDPLRLALDMDLILFAEWKGETIGFTLAVPDYNEVIKKLNGDLSFLKGLSFLRLKDKIRSGRLIAIGVAPSWRGRGVAPVLVAGAFNAMIRKGYTTCEYSWVVKENAPSINVARKFYSDAYKRYVIYSKKIT